MLTCYHCNTSMTPIHTRKPDGKLQTKYNCACGKAEIKSEPQASDDYEEFTEYFKRSSSSVPDLLREIEAAKEKAELQQKQMGKKELKMIPFPKMPTDPNFGFDPSMVPKAPDPIFRRAPPGTKVIITSNGKTWDVNTGEEVNNSGTPYTIQAPSSQTIDTLRGKQFDSVIIDEPWDDSDYE